MTTIDTIDLAGLGGGPVSLATKQLDELDCDQQRPQSDSRKLSLQGQCC